MTAQFALALEDAVTSSSQPGEKVERHLCTGCRTRPARFQYRGIVKADRLHTLCFQCYRAAMDRVRAANGRFPRAVVDDKYDDLARRRHRAQIAARHALEG